MKEESLSKELVVGLVGGLVVGLVVGLVGGLVYGLVVGLTTQIIAYFSSNLTFSSFDFWSMLILLIIIQVCGWYYVNKFKQNKEKK